MIPAFTGIERFRQRLSRLHPDHFRIARAAFWVGLFTFSAKLIAAGKEMAVAWRYGRGAEVDAYNLALTLSTWLPITLVSVMTIVLVPALVRLRGGDPLHRTRFLAELNGLCVWGALASMVFVGLFSMWGLSWYNSGLGATTLEMARKMLISFMPLAALTLFIGLYTVRMQANHDHRYALADGLPPLVIILLLWAWQTADSLPLLAGTLLGSALQALWLARQARRHDAVVGVCRRMESVEWPLLWRSALIMGLGQFAMSFTTPVDQYFAARQGAGAIATLGYTNRLVALGMALGATIISRATLPVFAEAIAAGQPERIRSLAFKWASLMMLSGLAAAGFIWWISPLVVGIFFERGAFDTRDTMAVAELLRYGVWQWPFYLGGLVLVQYTVAMNRHFTIATSGVIAILTKILSTAILTWWMGLNGVMLGSVIMYATTLLWFILISGKKAESHGIR